MNSIIDTPKPDRAAQWCVLVDLDASAKMSILHGVWGYVTSAEEHRNSMSPTEILDVIAKWAEERKAWSERTKVVCGKEA